MPSTQFSATDLKQLRQQLDAWRRPQTQRTPFPDEPAWEATATLACAHGVNQTQGRHFPAPCLAVAMELLYIRVACYVPIRAGCAINTGLDASGNVLQGSTA